MYENVIKNGIKIVREVIKVMYDSIWILFIK